jgi:hypothetical protein
VNGRVVKQLFAIDIDANNHQVTVVEYFFKNRL